MESKDRSTRTFQRRLNLSGAAGVLPFTCLVEKTGEGGLEEQAAEEEEQAAGRIRATIDGGQRASSRPAWLAYSIMEWIVTWRLSSTTLA